VSLEFLNIKLADPMIYNGCDIRIDDGCFNFYAFLRQGLIYAIDGGGLMGDTFLALRDLTLVFTIFSCADAV